MTFAEYAGRWRARQVHRASTAAQVQTYFRSRVYPRIGGRQLASLRPSDAQTFVKSLSSVGPEHRPLAPGTVEPGLRMGFDGVRCGGAGPSDRRFSVPRS